MPSDHQPQMLEEEDAEQRQERLRAILERLNGEGSSTAVAESPNLSFDFGVRRTFAMEPPTELLARVRQFLPQIELSNAELSQMDPRSIDIEHLEETDERVIEMNLGLGVFEQRGARRHSVSGSSSESESDSGSRATRDSSSSSSTSGGSSSSSDSEDDEDEDGPSRDSRSVRPLPRRADTVIQVLASRDEEDSSSAGDHPGT